MPPCQRARLATTRLVFRALRSRTNLFWVPTDSMREHLLELGVPPRRMFVAPFAAPLGSALNDDIEPRWDFGYISLPWAHKNHRRLIEAFAMLASRGMRPSLLVTVPRSMDPKLVEWIKEMKARYGIEVTNIGEVPLGRMGAVYSRMRALIFPSLTESFGLPLVEARALGLPVLAPERDYVRDVVAPAETFDPESPRSIMRAVLRFLGKAENPRPIGRGVEFVGELVRAARAEASGLSPH